MDAVTHRRQIAGLAERLIAEFSDTMPPGQILRLVHRANRLVLRSARDGSEGVAVCEAIARRLIYERVAQAKRRHAV